MGMRLPADTREAILVALESVDVPPSARGEFAIRPISGQSAASSIASVARSTSSTATSARSHVRSPHSAQVSIRDRPPLGPTAGNSRSSSARARYADGSQNTVPHSGLEPPIRQPPPLPPRRPSSGVGRPRGVGTTSQRETSDSSLARATSGTRSASENAPASNERRGQFDRTESPVIPVDAQMSQRNEASVSAQPSAFNRLPSDGARYPTRAPRRPTPPDATANNRAPLAPEVVTGRARSRSGDSRLRSAGQMVIGGDDLAGLGSRTPSPQAPSANRTALTNGAEGPRSRSNGQPLSRARAGIPLANRPRAPVGIGGDVPMRRSASQGRPLDY